MKHSFSLVMCYDLLVYSKKHLTRDIEVFTNIDWYDLCHIRDPPRVCVPMFGVVLLLGEVRGNMW